MKAALNFKQGEMIMASKRDIIAEAIEAGGATMESLIAAADCKYESIMSNFSMLRLMGKCPVKDVEVDGVLTYRFVSTEEWEQMKAEKATSATSASSRTRTSSKSPAQRLVAAEVRVARCEKAAENAQARANANEEDTLLGLRSDKAEIEMQIAQYELGTAQALVDADPEAKAEYEALTVSIVASEGEVSDENGDVQFD